MTGLYAPDPLTPEDAAMMGSLESNPARIIREDMDFLRNNARAAVQGMLANDSQLSPAMLASKAYDIAEEMLKEHKAREAERRRK